MTDFAKMMIASSVSAAYAFVAWNAMTMSWFFLPNLGGTKHDVMFNTTLPYFTVALMSLIHMRVQAWYDKPIELQNRGWMIVDILTSFSPVTVAIGAFIWTYTYGRPPGGYEWTFVMMHFTHLFMISMATAFDVGPTVHRYDSWSEIRAIFFAKSRPNPSQTEQQQSATS
jgi:hypothetical protein